MVTPASEANGQRRRMLVCLDLSAASETCLPYAIALAQTFGSEVTLMHVMQARKDHLGPQANDVLGWEISRQEARGYLGRIEAQVEKALGRRVDVRIEQGRPAERIVDVSRELDADLTVIASYGDGCVSPTGLGSTAQRILALLRGSVFVAHCSSPDSQKGATKRILVPLDGSLRTESVLPAVARLANAHGAEIVLAHVVRSPAHTALLGAEGDMELAMKLTARLEASAKLYLQRVRLQLTGRGTSVRALVSRHVSEHQGLLETAQREQTDLIVLSAHGSACDPARPVGSVTSFLLTHATMPLLVLQDLPELALSGAQALDAKLSSAGLRASYASESV